MPPAARSTDPKAVALQIAELHGLCRIQRHWRSTAGGSRTSSASSTRSAAASSWCRSGQGYKDISPAVDRLEGLVEEGKLRHDGHPVLAMAAANAKVEMDAAGNRKLSKRRSQGRIDPLVALTMAVGVAARPGPVIDINALIG